MSIITSQFKLQSSTLSNFVANGAIGTAAATVDVAAAFTINQTTAGVALTIPAPTVTTDNPIIFISNVGTVNLQVGGSILKPNTSSSFQWSSVNSTWNTGDTEGIKKFYVQQTLVAGVNTITHNLNLITPFKDLQLTVRDDATGQTVDVNITSYTANTIVLSPLSAVALANIVVIG